MRVRCEPRRASLGQSIQREGWAAAQTQARSGHPLQRQRFPSPGTVRPPSASFSARWLQSASRRRAGRQHSPPATTGHLHRRSEPECDQFLSGSAPGPGQGARRSFRNLGTGWQHSSRRCPQHGAQRRMFGALFGTALCVVQLMLPVAGNVVCTASCSVNAATFPTLPCVCVFGTGFENPNIATRATARSSANEVAISGWKILLPKTSYGFCDPQPCLFNASKQAATSGGSWRFGGSCPGFGTCTRGDFGLTVGRRFGRDATSTKPTFGMQASTSQVRISPSPLNSNSAALATNSR